MRGRPRHLPVAKAVAVVLGVTALVQLVAETRGLEIALCRVAVAAAKAEAEAAAAKAEAEVEAEVAASTAPMAVATVAVVLVNTVEMMVRQVNSVGIPKEGSLVSSMAAAAAAAVNATFLAGARGG